MYIIRYLLRYIINTKCCISSIRRFYARFRVMRYKGGIPPLIIYTALRTVMIYQSCGLDKKIPRTLFSVFFGGGWWIRTTEVSDNRFTVCPLWPLGKSPKSLQDWSWRTESNHQPADYKSAALPLSHASILSCNGDIVSHKYSFVNRKFKNFLFSCFV